MNYNSAPQHSGKKKANIYGKLNQIVSNNKLKETCLYMQWIGLKEVKKQKIEHELHEKVCQSIYFMFKHKKEATTASNIEDDFGDDDDLDDTLSYLSISNCLLSGTSFIRVPLT